jgi:hypothetical protein
MSNPFKNWRKKPVKKDTTKGKEFSFIWYKKMKVGNTTYYTKTFRTKVTADNFEQAKEKVTNFALNKMTLVIVPEDKFNETDISKLENISKQCEEINNTAIDILNSITKQNLNV